MVPPVSPMVIREGNAGAWYHRGQIFCTREKFDEAIACYDTAIELAPGNPIIWRRKGFALLKAGRYGEAAASFDQALAIDPGDATTWQRKSYVLACLGKHEGAIACCETALMLDPGYIFAWQSRGWLLAARPGHGPATQHLESIDIEALASEIQDAGEFIDVPACIREVVTERDYENAGLARAVLRELAGRAERPPVRGP